MTQLHPVVMKFEWQVNVLYHCLQCFSINTYIYMCVCMSLYLVDLIVIEKKVLLFRAVDGIRVLSRTELSTLLF